jgi:hypothetical protein
MSSDIPEETRKEIKEKFEKVSEGDQVVWDNTEGDTRSRTQPVVEVTDSYFRVKGNRGGEYKFYKKRRTPQMKNLNMDRIYKIARFEIK